MKERWDLNRRAVRLLCHLDRKYFLCTLFSSLTTAIAPYIPCLLYTTDAADD